MSVRVMTAVWALDLPDSQKIVLLALADCANDEGHCWPSMASLSKKCSKSARTIQGVIKDLVAAGHVTRDERPGKGVNYLVHPRSGPSQTTTKTPAKTAPRKDCGPPPQRLRATPAAAAGHPRSGCGQTVIEPSKKHKTARAVVCPDGLDQEVWLDWLRVRRRPPTPTAMAAIEREAGSAGMTVPQAITVAAENGWQGFRADWLPKRKLNPTRDGWELPIA